MMITIYRRRDVVFCAATFIAALAISNNITIGRNKLFNTHASSDL